MLGRLLRLKARGTARGEGGVALAGLNFSSRLMLMQITTQSCLYCCKFTARQVVAVAVADNDGLRATNRRSSLFAGPAFGFFLSTRAATEKPMLNRRSL